MKCVRRIFLVFIFWSVAKVVIVLGGVFLRLLFRSAIGIMGSVGELVCYVIGREDVVVYILIVIIFYFF